MIIKRHDLAKILSPPCTVSLNLIALLILRRPVLSVVSWLQLKFAQFLLFTRSLVSVTLTLLRFGRYP